LGNPSYDPIHENKVKAGVPEKVKDAGHAMSEPVDEDTEEDLQKLYEKIVKSNM
jgi:hypothetical protein